MKTILKSKDKKKQLFIFFTLVGLLAFSLLWFAINADYNPNISFLKSDSNAYWIVYKLHPDTTPRTDVYVNLNATFIKQFYMEEAPRYQSLIHLKAFKKYRIWVNENELISEFVENKNWKKKHVYHLSRYLKKGINEIKIIVQCKYGPPALWLYSQGMGEKLTTDSTWFVSLNRSPFTKAALADDSFIHPANKEIQSPFRIFVKKLPLLIAFMLVVLCLNYFIIYRKKLISKDPEPRITYFSSAKLVLSLCIGLWILLLINNFFKLPYNFGFDAQAHIQNVDYIIKYKSIPLGNQGWEAHQPPLFYFLSAIFLYITKLFYSADASYYILKLIPFFSGAGQVVLIYFASKHIFPEDGFQQSIAIAFSAIIPMNIYISSYVSNESLSAFFNSLSILIVIKLITSSKPGMKYFLLLGCIIGISIMTKISCIVILPVIYFLIFLKLLFVERYNPFKVVTLIVIMSSVIVFLGGWFYIRNFLEIGKTMITPWEDMAPVSWWQDPGYHTFNYFFQFGKVFSMPYFAGFYSFFDSLYSTFWSDSNLGGNAAFGFRPPWNYEYMSIIIIMAIPTIFIILIGFLNALKNVIILSDKIWVLLTGTSFMIALSIIQINFKFPYYSHAKAFFGLSAILPISIFFAAGFGWIDKWLKKYNLFLFRSTLYSWFYLLIFIVFLSFFITKDQTDRPIDLTTFTKQDRLDYAIDYYKNKLLNNTETFFSHSMLTQAYFIKKQFDIAIEHCQQALNLNPDHPYMQSTYAKLLLLKSDSTTNERLQAVRHAEYSCQLTGYLNPEMLMVLTSAYVKSAKTAQARDIAYQALSIAESFNKYQLTKRIRDMIIFYKLQ